MDYNMDFSFIIPIYNSQSRLKQCVESVIQLEELCSYEFEIILVDDGSADYSVELVDAFAVANKRFFSIHQKNKGVSAARNIGLKSSRGKYIVFIDSDDSIEPERFAECMNIVTSDENIDVLVYGLSFDYYSKKNLLYRSDEMIPPYEGIKTLSECQSDIDILYDRNCLSPIWNKIIKKSILDDTFLCEDMFLLEDLEYSLRLLRKCKYVYFYQDVVYRYYQAENSIDRIKRLENICEITDKIGEALDNLGCSKDHIVSCITDWFLQSKLSSMRLKEIKKEYPERYYNELMTRPYRRIRHSTANWLKQHIGDFRKWQKYQ